MENLGPVYDKGLRHLQFVHYIRTPVGDFQTVAPVHNGLSEMGKRLIEACNAQGVLVDLAHSTGVAVDQALESGEVPVSQPFIKRDLVKLLQGPSDKWTPQAARIAQREPEPLLEEAGDVLAVVVATAAELPRHDVHRIDEVDCGQDEGGAEIGRAHV